MPKNDSRGSSDPPVAVPSWKQLLVEEPATLEPVANFRGFGAMQGHVTWNRSSGLAMNLQLELREYIDDEARQRDLAIRTLCRFTVNGCSDGSGWRAQLRRKAAHLESDLERLLKNLTPLTCQLSGEVLTKHSTFDVSPRMGIVHPDLKQAERFRSRLGRIARGGFPVLWELWLSHDDRQGLTEVQKGYVWALRIKLSQLIDQAFWSDRVEGERRDRLFARLSALLAEETSLVGLQRENAQAIAQQELIIEDSKTVDLWIPEDAEEPDRTRLRRHIHRLSVERDNLPAKSRKRAATERQIWLREIELGRIESGRVTRRRLLGEKIAAAELALRPLLGQRKELAARNDCMFLEREALCLLLNNKK